jgi:hypothetical protein
MINYFKDSRWSKDIVLLPLLDVFTEKENYQGRKKKSKVVHMDHKLCTPPKSLNPHILI